ncbi:MAG TPA: metallophosphoesterase [Caulobacteraceae bacterium]|jgi:3',5'-cyclic AMP phosphodiesterase CpdA|nr:metallophosphoesterase [Caulobacteraceae bacterium]
MSGLEADGESRRGFLKCMTWAGTGLVWTVAGGVPASIGLEAAAATTRAAPFSFVQVSDSHIGFAKPFNPDARNTYREAIAKIAAMPKKPDFIIHTGDVSQLSKDDQFDDADQIIKTVGVPVFHIPGEHDVLDEGQGKAFLARYGKGTKGAGWYSFNHGGVHFVALVNVVNLKAGGLGSLGPEQLAWLKDDLAAHGPSTPIVVFAHIPLWALYPDWGWATEESAQALALLSRFGSVTVLNGHIHQVQQKVEGRVAFYTARSTAFPQASPGAPGMTPGPMAVPADKLRGVLGVREVSFVARNHTLPVVDQTLA